MSNGLETGKKENSKEIAIKLLKKGMNIDFVQQTTDLSIDEIKKLKKNL